MVRPLKLKEKSSNITPWMFQKEVVSYASVQRYLTEIWTGRVDWSFGKTVAFALVVFLCPPAWFYFSLPLDSRIGRAPIIKFVCHIGKLKSIFS